MSGSGGAKACKDFHEQNNPYHIEISIKLSKEARALLYNQISVTLTEPLEHCEHLKVGRFSTSSGELLGRCASDWTPGSACRLMSACLLLTQSAEPLLARKRCGLPTTRPLSKHLPYPGLGHHRMPRMADEYTCKPLHCHQFLTR